MTAQAESLLGIIERTIDTELVDDISFLAKYDETKQMIQEIIKMSNRIMKGSMRASVQVGTFLLIYL